MDDERHGLEGEGTPTLGGDLVGPGTGGSPTAAGTGDEDDANDAREAAGDPEVARLVAELRHDRDAVEGDTTHAAEQAGTGTDR